MKDKESKDSLVVQNLHLKQMNIEELIYEVRGQNVMIDSDLAMIYEEETKYLKRAVRAHIKRFPSDFMFELTKEEYAALRCKNSTINKGLSFNSSCIGWHEALPLTRFDSSLAVFAFSAVLPSFW